jgi:hypothetical protein
MYFSILILRTLTGKHLEGLVTLMLSFILGMFYRMNIRKQSVIVYRF